MTAEEIREMYRKAFDAHRATDANLDKVSLNEWGAWLRALQAELDRKACELAGDAA